MSNLEKYRKIFCETFDVADEELGDEFTPDNVSVWDSLAHISLIGALEDSFNVMFETDDILHFGGYSNGIEILKRLGVDFEK